MPNPHSLDFFQSPLASEEFSAGSVPTGSLQAIVFKFC
jgi:hypothetical protein